MRLIVVSNRLPVKVNKVDNNFVYKQSSGGLATGLICLKNTTDFIWVGNMNLKDFSEEEKVVVEKDCWEKYKSIPLFLDPELDEKYYNGFCNCILWPLLHTFQDEVTFSLANWEAYTKASEQICEKIASFTEDGDIIWVHDYHLMILPRLIKEKIKKNIKIGFFLHTPFPSSEIFSVLPVRKDIILGLLSADLVSFHSYEYLTHFINTCEKMFPKIENFCNGTDFKALKIISDENEDIKKLKLIYEPDNIQIGHKTIQVAVTPIGIDPKMFTDILKREKCRARINELRRIYKNKFVFLGIDRVDYIKGIPNRIQGVERFIQRYPEYIDNFVFLQIGVPSRIDVVEYESLVSVINMKISELNSKYGSVDQTFFYFLNKSVEQSELCALYALGDSCVITSLRDGMNLVALEYISCQEDNKGILILSEFAGAMQTVPGALSINPWNIDEIADAMKNAMVMTQQERKERYDINKIGIEKFTAAKWAKDNLDILMDLHK
ncbi:alpha,alpha-trehalose-phosphate synthase [Hamiltosporidium tvaerminnensis]|uniref:Alpha,alpha-trehalose-phosphate synthase n=2 Tax=Hamiltosporidium TaxID=1176354 RepID=A0A4Q9L087_9MICR|nr:Trehalose-6-P synthase/phosphatase complex synthase subunit [Hamiltosporidium tvaerminnensis]TBT99919.1 alpha,alpha-trehalose-phosphate synthase [Hamiltosporidium tvaerminnensis]TBU07553.1 alpha,alpha-trehalose-phosphate synthase [Hamiltosporidium magnivora]TBU10230.1 alpha,alpha-trehalose-phosphate synthase [Hamiltosporidium tvaerminnensis]